MAKSNKEQRQMNSTERCSVSISGSAGYMENTFCVVLHVVEAINFHGREGERDQIIMNAALNTVDFEVEGTPSVTNETIVFNSNCIWECDMAGIKRIKTDHRPVKVTFFACNSNMVRKTIGTLLLPIRGLPVLGVGGNNSAVQLKMFWHKLICIGSEFRSHKPEVLLMLSIIKKSLLITNDFKHLLTVNGPENQMPSAPMRSPGQSITANMLQSQANVYVQSLVQLGLLQVGNDPLVDCDIIEVVLQLNQLKNVNKFIRSINHGKDVDSVLLLIDFVGNITTIEIKLNNTDLYSLGDVLGLRFKSSLRSIRLYFQRIFYLPINMYINGYSIANYRMDFGKMLPSDRYFDDKRQYSRNGYFAFERFGRMASARELKPILDYTFSVDIQELCWREQMEPPTQHTQLKVHQKEPIYVNSVSSSAVILEVPQDLGELKHVQRPKDNASIGSLNVGAELSASDASDSMLSDETGADSDVPTALHRSKAHRKKFTRLIESNSGQKNEVQYCRASARSKDVDVKCLPQQQRVDKNDFHDEIESDAELLAIYNNSKFCRQVPNADDERSAQNAKDLFQRCLEEPAAPIIERQPTKSARSEIDKIIIKPVEAKITLKKVPVNKQPKLPCEKSSRYLDEQIPAEEHILPNNERIVENACHQLEQENENMSQIVVKERRKKRIVKSMPAQEITPNFEESALPKVRKSKVLALSTDTDEMETSLPEEAIKAQCKRSTRKTAIPIDDSFNDTPKIIHKKKIVAKQEELEIVDVAEMPKIVRKSLNNSKISARNRYLSAEECLDDAENDVSEEIVRQSRVALVKKHNNLVVERFLDADTSMETEEQELLGQKSYNNKNRSIHLINVSAESESVLRKKPAKAKRISASKANIGLSARWVEVNQEQTKTLEETEKFIGETCKSKPVEVISQEQFSGSPKKLAKNVRNSVRKCEEYLEANFSSEIKPSVDNSFLEEELRAAKSERKLLRKKATTNIRQGQDFTDIESQTKLLRPKARIAKEPIQLEIQDVGNQEAILCQSHEMKLKHSVRHFLNVEAASLRELTSNVSLKNSVDGSEKPIKKRSVNTAPYEPKEPDSSELDIVSLKPKKSTKKLIKTKSNEMQEHAPCCDNKKKHCSGESQLDADAQISRLEVTVHMYDQTKTTAAGPAEVNEMNENIKQILAAGKLLQDEMHLRCNTSQKELGTNTAHKSSQCGIKEQPVTTTEDYEFKFNELEQHIAVLEDHLHDFESRAQEMHEENLKLAQEKLLLQERVMHMEQQMSHLRSQKGNGQQMQKLLNEMRTQNVRYLDMSKAKDQYKKQWLRCARRVHTLKLTMHEKNVQQEYQNLPQNKLNLKSILTQDADEFEREYGRFRKSEETLSFSGSGYSSEPLLKDYLHGLSTQTMNKQKPANCVDSTRMH